MSSPSAERYIDLHLHSNLSDGSDEPARVVERAAQAGLSAIAITDHDTLSGLPEAMRAGEEHGVEVVSGVEISARHGGSEIHILGLGIDPDDEALRYGLEELARERDLRAVRIVERMNELGVDITLEGLRARAGAGVIGRMHIALEIVDAGHASHVQNAFDKYIKAGKPGYVAKKNMDAEVAVERIHGAGGLAFVAHPGIGRSKVKLGSVLKVPFDGIEAYHSRHTPQQVAEYRALAKERGLLVSGGSDCHGTVKGDRPLMGTVQVPYEVLERIREAIGDAGSAI